jgi:DNA-binding NarL/FixJ family response regulator
MRIVLADDSALLREGLARLLADEGHDVVAGVGDGDAMVEAVTRHRPDVVVADVRMPPTHTDEGLRAALEVRRTSPDVGVLVLSQYVEKRYAIELLTGGAAAIGYLLKDRVAHVDDFLAALDRVAEGGAAFDPEVVRQLLARTSHSDPLDTLTPRERDVLARMAEGCTNAGIAEALHVSRSAVEKHVNAIFDKLALPPSSTHSRRILAILRYLGS